MSSIFCNSCSTSVASEQRAIGFLTDLLGIPGPSGLEGPVIEYLTGALHAAGVPYSSMTKDDAHKSSTFGGEIGNLIVNIAGDQRLPRRLFMAHCDTVPLCVGTIPVRDGRFIKSANAESGLGADNRTGVAVLLNLAFELAALDGRHPPVTLFWTVQEEVGMLGVRHVSVDHLRRPKLAFNIDGGRANKLTIGATGCYRMTMEFLGKAAHAALRPEEGINAITAAAVAIQALNADGLLGRVGTGDLSVTTNVGTIDGGTAVNVVPNRVLVQAEVRGHDPDARRRVLETVCRTVRDAVAVICDRNGNSATVRITPRLDYEAFRLDPNEPCLLAAERAIQFTGMTAIQAITSGGIDANWMISHGIPVVSFGAGQVDGHTMTEKVNLDEFEAACRIAFALGIGEKIPERCSILTDLKGGEVCQTQY